MEGEGVEQLQPTALDSEETTTAGTCAKQCAMVYMCDYTLIIYPQYHVNMCIHLGMWLLLPHHNDNVCLSGAVSESGSEQEVVPLSTCSATAMG